MNRGRKIFNAFLIIVASTILFLLPLTLAVEAFKTDTQEDTFSLVTAVDETSENVVFSETLYESDTTSISMLSDLATDTLSWSSYNSTANRIQVDGLTGNATRTITATYDIDALGGNTAIITVADRLAWFWLLVCIAFAPMALAAIFIGRD